MTLRLALVGGPMYDGLYDLLEGRDVAVVVHAPHPELNRQVATMMEAHERIDVLSTHSKYAPSQAMWLHPLDDVVDVGSLAPRAVDLCRFEGTLLCAPRNIDVRVLWSAHDAAVPRTWDELARSSVVFGFPGRESGLFGTFFELVVGQGGRLFDDDLNPTLATPETRAAVETLVTLARRAPVELTDWHYDEVNTALISGRVELAAAWPGATATLRAARPDLEPHPYLAGPCGVRSYAGCHAWAIPRTCADLDAAVELVAFLTSAAVHTRDAANGAVCAHRTAFAEVPPLDATDARRLAITRATISDGMLTYPPLARLPAIEDAGWSGIRAALLGEVTVDAALSSLQHSAEVVLDGASADG